MRLSLACAVIFGVGLLLGLYFSQTPPGAPLASENPGGMEDPSLEAPAQAYQLFTPPQPPRVKPEIEEPPKPSVAAILPEAKPVPKAPVAADPPPVRTAAVPLPDPAPPQESEANYRSQALPAEEATVIKVSEQVVPAAWQQNAALSDAPLDKPWIAIVLDDVGVNQSAAWEAIELPAPLTLAFMTYAENLPRMTRQARLQGHELMVHFPMEPQDLPHNDPGKNALLLGLSGKELSRRLDWGLSRFDGYVGINNHMGSRFTEQAELLRPVMAELRRRGLLFLDSRTSQHSVAGQVARQAGLPVASRDVFLDHVPTKSFVRQQLSELESLAKQRGYAVGIGHPHDYTMETLRAWLPEAKARGFAIVPLTAIVKRRGEVG